MKLLKFFLFLTFFWVNMGSSANMNVSIFDFSFFDIDGKLVKLENFKGKPLLIVNTASRCGFTPQYKNLQNLFIKYKETDLTIIAITSNSFNQEYSSSEEIKKICLVNYDIGFITSAPIDVKGENIHSIFHWIKEEYNQSPKWNFYKYLFDRNGKLLKSWSSITKPDSGKIQEKIDSII